MTKGMLWCKAQHPTSETEAKMNPKNWCPGTFNVAETPHKYPPKIGPLALPNAAQVILNPFTLPNWALGAIEFMITIELVKAVWDVNFVIANAIKIVPCIVGTLVSLESPS